ncbi:BZ3500_MvSof-1268-A1-R1_Chr8-1g09909 [Microbotryum saponariae]|uniref:BZ3500_MvSof-1268-A1-R1_Chr8-1g09909 protein n=1 Tax=Microbotryum saponariae TaxID=289078 RepID=A0A2X0KUD7_9BASI|nr:BZ3500_MvSof-1268-A1-R1_Chr8-1g09909 [Microbotryum saponariae]SDA08195.1 BZ3501_MvSof-1269-A2-R1_Chr8-1g09632 [Microbotryum saponariae]
MYPLDEYVTCIPRPRQIIVKKWRSTRNSLALLSNDVLQELRVVSKGRYSTHMTDGTTRLLESMLDKSLLPWNHPRRLRSVSLLRNQSHTSGSVTFDLSQQAEARSLFFDAVTDYWTLLCLCVNKRRV